MRRVAVSGALGTQHASGRHGHGHGQALDVDETLEDSTTAVAMRQGLTPSSTDQQSHVHTHAGPLPQQLQQQRRQRPRRTRKSRANRLGEIDQADSWCREDSTSSSESAEEQSVSSADGDQRLLHKRRQRDGVQYLVQHGGVDHAAPSRAAKKAQVSPLITRRNMTTDMIEEGRRHGNAPMRTDKTRRTSAHLHGRHGRHQHLYHRLQGKKRRRKSALRRSPVISVICCGPKMRSSGVGEMSQDARRKRRLCHILIATISVLALVQTLLFATFPPVVPGIIPGTGSTWQKAPLDVHVVMQWSDDHIVLGDTSAAATEFLSVSGGDIIAKKHADVDTLLDAMLESILQQSPRVEEDERKERSSTRTATWCGSVRNFAAWYEELDHDKQRSVRSLVHKGVLDIAGGSWSGAALDYAICPREMMIADFMVGLRWLDRHFDGYHPRSAWIRGGMAHRASTVARLKEMGYDQLVLGHVPPHLARSLERHGHSQFQWRVGGSSDDNMGDATATMMVHIVGGSSVAGHDMWENFDALARHAQRSSRGMSSSHVLLVVTLPSTLHGQSGHMKSEVAKQPYEHIDAMLAAFKNTQSSSNYLLKSVQLSTLSRYFGVMGDREKAGSVSRSLPLFSNDLLVFAENDGRCRDDRCQPFSQFQAFSRRVFHQVNAARVFVSLYSLRGGTVDDDRYRIVRSRLDGVLGNVLGASDPALISAASNLASSVLRSVLVGGLVSPSDAHQSGVAHHPGTNDRIVQVSNENTFSRQYGTAMNEPDVSIDLSEVAEGTNFVTSFPIVIANSLASRRRNVRVRVALLNIPPSCFELDLPTGSDPGVSGTSSASAPSRDVQHLQFSLKCAIKVLDVDQRAVRAQLVPDLEQSGWSPCAAFQASHGEDVGEAEPLSAVHLSAMTWVVHFAATYVPPVGVATYFIEYMPRARVVASSSSTQDTQDTGHVVVSRVELFSGLNPGHASVFRVRIAGTCVLWPLGASPEEVELRSQSWSVTLVHGLIARVRSRPRSAAGRRDVEEQRVDQKFILYRTISRSNAAGERIDHAEGDNIIPFTGVPTHDLSLQSDPGFYFGAGVGMVIGSLLFLAGVYALFTVVTGIKIPWLCKLRWPLFDSVPWWPLFINELFLGALLVGITAFGYIWGLRYGPEEGGGMAAGVSTSVALFLIISTLHHARGVVGCLESCTVVVFTLFSIFVAFPALHGDAILSPAGSGPDAVASILLARGPVVEEATISFSQYHVGQRISLWDYDCEGEDQFSSGACIDIVVHAGELTPGGEGGVSAGDSRQLFMRLHGTSNSGGMRLFTDAGGQGDGEKGEEPPKMRECQWTWFTSSVVGANLCPAKYLASLDGTGLSLALPHTAGVLSPGRGLLDVLLHHRNSGNGRAPTKIPFRLLQASSTQLETGDVGSMQLRVADFMNRPVLAFLSVQSMSNNPPTLHQRMPSSTQVSCASLSSNRALPDDVELVSATYIDHEDETSTRSERAPAVLLQFATSLAGAGPSRAKGGGEDSLSTIIERDNERILTAIKEWTQVVVSQGERLSRVARHKSDRVVQSMNVQGTRVTSSADKRYRHEIFGLLAEAVSTARSSSFAASDEWCRHAVSKAEIDAAVAVEEESRHAWLKRQTELDLERVVMRNEHVAVTLFFAMLLGTCAFVAWFVRSLARQGSSSGRALPD